MVCVWTLGQARAGMIVIAERSKVNAATGGWAPDPGELSRAAILAAC
jgi:hypothetical protein